MSRKWLKLILIIGVLVLIGFISWGPIMSNVEHPKYQVLSSEGKIEIRIYNPMIVAEVTVQGERKEAISEGFRFLADYIFGNNIKNSSISMTAPVMQQQNQKIAMTAPVSQLAADDGWIVNFVMPAEYSLDTLPKPNNNKVVIKEIPSKEFAVIQFSGMNTNNNISSHEEKLKSYVVNKELIILSDPVYAFYNPPWTLPLLRRNEVLIEIDNVNKLMRE
ncbi:MAG: heme-binding protein [Gammaproteobacteria bacterium]|nr:heme-binding protein [Gammaproteobacteria bacterium]